MTKYLALFHASKEVMEKMKKKTHEEMQEVKRVWFAWAEKVGSSLIEMGPPLGKSEFIGGEGSSDIGTYTFVEAESMEQAKALFNGHPHLNHGTIEVLPCMPMPGR
jgi:hypothetical protein